MEYVYRVVDKDGEPLRTSQSNARQALYASSGAARTVATNANADDRDWGTPGKPQGRPYHAQRASVNWEDLDV